MSAMSTSVGIDGISGEWWGLPLLMKAPDALRKFTMARRPLSEPKRVMVSCNLEIGVRNFLHLSVRRGQRWRICSHTAVGLGASCHHIHSPSPCWLCWSNMRCGSTDHFMLTIIPSSFSPSSRLSLLIKCLGVFVEISDQYGNKVRFGVNK